MMRRTETRRTKSFSPSPLHAAARPPPLRVVNVLFVSFGSSSFRTPRRTATPLASRDPADPAGTSLVLKARAARSVDEPRRFKNDAFENLVLVTRRRAERNKCSDRLFLVQALINADL